MFEQLSGHPMAHSCWHIKLTIKYRLRELDLAVGGIFEDKWREGRDEEGAEGILQMKLYLWTRDSRLWKEGAGGIEESGGLTGLEVIMG